MYIYVYIYIHKYNDNNALGSNLSNGLRLRLCVREFVRECESVCLSVVVHALITRLRELCAGECTLPWAVPECPHVEQCCGFFNSLHTGQARRHTLVWVL